MQVSPVKAGKAAQGTTKKRKKAPPIATALAAPAAELASSWEMDVAGLKPEDLTPEASTLLAQALVKQKLVDDENQRVQQRCDMLLRRLSLQRPLLLLLPPPLPLHLRLPRVRARGRRLPPKPGAATTFCALSSGPRAARK